MRPVQLVSLPLIALAFALAPAQAEAQGSEFDAQWSDFSMTPTLDEFASEPQRAPAPPPSEAETARGLELDVNGNKVGFGTIEGAAGARITPRSSNLSVGVGVAPSDKTLEEGLPEGFAAFSDGVDGALELKLNEGPVTPSMTVTGPLDDGSGSGKGDEFKTMFGLGYSF